MLVEEKGVRIIFDPGKYSTQQSEVKHIDVALITHEHSDHLDIDSLKQLISNNPDVIIYTNHSVGVLLGKKGISFSILEDGQNIFIEDVSIEGIGSDHACMHQSIMSVENTGYLIAGRLFYPGDAFTHPQRKIEILALPVAGPWMKLSEAIDYAIAVNPSFCFPVHEGILKVPGSTHLIPPKVLEGHGITFSVFEIDKEYEV